MLTLAAIFMLLTFCDVVGVEYPRSQLDLHVSLINDSSRDVQILGEGEQPEQSRVLAPNASREITFKNVEKGDVFRFRALVFEESIGGAWLEVADQACVWSSVLQEATIVSYRGGITLVCENW